MISFLSVGASFQSFSQAIPHSQTPAAMSARRSSRLRRKPTPIYQVEDTRASDDETNAEEEQQETLVDNEQVEESRYVRMRTRVMVVGALGSCQIPIM